MNIILRKSQKFKGFNVVKIKERRVRLKNGKIKKIWRKLLMEKKYFR